LKNRLLAHWSLQAVEVCALPINKKKIRRRVGYYRKTNLQTYAYQCDINVFYILSSVLFCNCQMFDVENCDADAATFQA